VVLRGVHGDGDADRIGQGQAGGVSLEQDSSSRQVSLQEFDGPFRHRPGVAKQSGHPLGGPPVCAPDIEAEVVMIVPRGEEERALVAALRDGEAEPAGVKGLAGSEIVYAQVNVAQPRVRVQRSGGGRFGEETFQFSGAETIASVPPSRGQVSRDRSRASSSPLPSGSRT